MANRELRITTLDYALFEVRRLVEARSRNNEVAFRLGQALSHCAQSIDYSMTGYPAMMNVLIRQTAGKLRFRSFVRQRKMKHDLDKPIPGATKIPANTSPRDGLEHLEKSVADFANFHREHEPHFAYGKLTKDEYELAHSFHIANHLSTFSAGSNQRSRA